MNFCGTGDSKTELALALLSLESPKRQTSFCICIISTVKCSSSIFLR